MRTEEEIKELFPLGREFTNTNLYPQCTSKIKITEKSYFVKKGTEWLVREALSINGRDTTYSGTYTVEKDNVLADIILTELEKVLLVIYKD